MFIFFLIIFFISSHIIGELSLFIIFRLRRIFFNRITNLDVVKSIDITSDNKLLKFYEKNFKKDVLDKKKFIDYYSMFDYCKDFLLENSFQSYVKARKIEARNNLKGGVIIPLIISMIICLLYSQWILSFFITLISSNIFLWFF